MTGWYKSNSDMRGKPASQGRPANGEPLATDGGILGFTYPGQPVVIPYPTGPVVPGLVPKPGKLAPVPAEIRKGRDFGRAARKAQAAARKAKLAAYEAERLKKLGLAKLSKVGLSNVYKTAFHIGWEIGDYYFPVGHPIYYWGQELEGDPTEWSHPDYCFYQCPGTPLGEHQGFMEFGVGSSASVGDGSCSTPGGSFGSQNCQPATPGINQGETLYPDPAQVPQAFPPNVNPIIAVSRSPAGDAIGKYETYATWWPGFGTTFNPDGWVERCAETGQAGTCAGRDTKGERLRASSPQGSGSRKESEACCP